MQFRASVNIRSRCSHDLSSFIYDDHVIDDEIINVAATAATSISRFDVQYVVCSLQVVTRCDEQNVSIPRILARTCRQATKDIDSIDSKDISLVIDVTRLKHQESSFAGIDIGTIEREVLRRSGKHDLGLDVVKTTLLVAKVLPLSHDSW